jgi:hypothetical protein
VAFVVTSLNARRRRDRGPRGRLGGADRRRQQGLGLEAVLAELAPARPATSTLPAVPHFRKLGTEMAAAEAKAAEVAACKRAIAAKKVTPGAGLLACDQPGHRWGLRAWPLI